jgi:hypothetical protein
MQLPLFITELTGLEISDEFEVKYESLREKWEKHMFEHLISLNRKKYFI